jgi:hypothetical protein
MCKAHLGAAHGPLSGRVAEPLLPQARSPAKGLSVFLHFASLAQCYVWDDDGAHRAHYFKALCLPHCFRILQHGVISAVLKSLKKQLFHLANITQAKPSSFSKERAPAQGWTNTCWARVPLVHPGPYQLLQGTAQFHWSPCEKSGARPAA